MSLPEAGWELFIVPKSYYCVFNGSLCVAFAFAPAPPLAILELIYTMWEFCYLFNRGQLPFSSTSVVRRLHFVLFCFVSPPGRRANHIAFLFSFFLSL
jgi:hypothetical protein